MINLTKIILSNIFSLNRYSKQLIALLWDIFLCIFCTWIAFYLRFEYWLSIKPSIDQKFLFEQFNYLSVLTSIIIAIPLFWLFGL